MHRASRTERFYLSAPEAKRVIHDAAVKEFDAYSFASGKCKRWARNRVSCLAIVHSSSDGCLAGTAHVARSRSTYTVRWMLRACLG